MTTFLMSKQIGTTTDYSAPLHTSLMILVILAIFYHFICV